ncbi:MAG TPA: anthranilate synthase component I [Gelria sp.]|jgi:anthranilate synthase|nr:anthranilate synthase component I [Gelria sp.]
MNKYSPGETEFTSRSYTSRGGVNIRREAEEVEVTGASDYILEQIDYQKGALFSSSYEYPGRYSQWDIGFIEPCLQLRARQQEFVIEALSENGQTLLVAINRSLAFNKDVTGLRLEKNRVAGSIKTQGSFFKEEERSRQPSIFSIIRGLKELLMAEEDRFLGLYGAFGYDLIFQFEPIKLKQERSPDQWDLILYLPDKLLVVDHRMEKAYHLSYAFTSTAGELELSPTDETITNETVFPLPRHQPGCYARKAELAKKAFKEGKLFEVVLSHKLYEPCPDPPAQVFNRLRSLNPSPYGFIINLGPEVLVGASPEMYVRVEGNRVETCPISGTIRRGKDALEDEIQIRKLLNSSKDEAELTMCTDVDRNDKSRICKPGSVQVIGRRQIELYSHVIHTVDHVEGYLRKGFDALDAFLTHMWAVTITGAPKRAAIKWLEENEDSPREWYGGAVGFFTFNGDLNTGLTLRTISIKQGVAEIRVGATLLYDSIPENEEAETYMKAAALIKSLRSPDQVRAPEKDYEFSAGRDKKILLIDHEDSFVHTLANYFRQTGAQVEVIRWHLAPDIIKADKGLDLVVLSPGPGYPADFNTEESIQCCIDKNIPVFGVGSGLQAIVEYFGGQLGVLDYPRHGKSYRVKLLQPGKLWKTIPREFTVGCYQALYVTSVPDCLKVTAISEDNVVMAVEHQQLHVAAVQFHPESILSTQDNLGLKMIFNVTARLAGKK